MNMSSQKAKLYKNVSSRFAPRQENKERLSNILKNGTSAEFLRCNKTILVDTPYDLKSLYLQLKAQVSPERKSIYMGNDKNWEKPSRLSDRILGLGQRDYYATPKWHF